MSSENLCPRLCILHPARDHISISKKVTTYTIGGMELATKFEELIEVLEGRSVIVRMQHIDLGVQLSVGKTSKGGSFIPFYTVNRPVAQAYAQENL